MRATSIQTLQRLQHHPDNIRNICILAHVDHGKTTLADSLVASNGLISQRLAGKLRYMDSREDEQIRGITMKSSAVSLHFAHSGQDYLINLIDSPGHIDFSSEVSTAVRLCDGAIILVDCVEGVCPQTHAVLRQAWMESIKPVLVLNKIDRLITELKMTPLEAHLHLRQILEHINSVTAELFASEAMEKSAASQPKSCDSVSTGDQLVFEWNAVLEDSDDSHIYFSPDQGNVVFASALEGWGFGISHFAELYSKKLGISADLLKKTLWGDYYLDAKNKRIRRGALSKGKKPLFVGFILENLWDVYDCIVIQRDKEKTERIVQTLQLQIPSRDLRSGDPSVLLRSLCSQWLPLATAVLDMVVLQLPSPNHIGPERAETLLCGPGRSFSSLPLETQALKADFLACKSDDGSPVIVYVSKMIPVEKKFLPHNKPKPLTTEEIAARRERVRQRHAQRMAAKVNESSSEVEAAAAAETAESSADPVGGCEQRAECPPEEGEEDHVFVAFARIFSGSLHKGQQLYVLGPKHDPSKALTEFPDEPESDAWQHIKSVDLEELYLFMGRELEQLSQVPAGNILGLTGLSAHILKSATLSSSVACPAFTHLYTHSAPIVRVALEPKNPSDMKRLAEGLRLLHQADPCVQVLVQDTGEHVIVTAGEIHLNKCLEDLVQRYAKVEVNVSAPIVPFRETIIPPPKTDILNEEITDQNQIMKKESTEEEEEGAESDDASDNSEENDQVLEPGLVRVRTAQGQCTLCLRAAPLPPAVTDLLVENAELIKILGKSFEKASDFQMSQETLSALTDFKVNLERAFQGSNNPLWANAVQNIWSFGPKRCGPNVLLNHAAEVQRPSLWSALPGTKASRGPWAFANSVVSGFQIATQAGPLCEEPLMGVGFILESVETCSSPATEDLVLGMADLALDAAASVACANNYTGLSGQIMSCFKAGCRKAFQSQPQRLMAAMYTCHIQATADVLGKMYAVLGKRGGRVLKEDLIEGSSVFNITAVLPVIESFGAVDEFRKRTSGLANPQLSFSHWEVIDMDPFWVPSTEEEYTHFGEKADSENIARKYMNSVRRRKGLWVKEQIVEFAEKQRTLTKNK